MFLPERTGKTSTGPDGAGVPGIYSILLIYLSRFDKDFFFSMCELLVFPVHERKNTVLKRVVQEFVTFSKHCSCKRELGKQVTVSLKMFEHPNASGVPGKTNIMLI